jgi:MFS family permease
MATSYLAASSVVSASCAALGPIIGGLCADFFAVHELNLAFTWKTEVDASTLQVLNMHGWTFYFGLAFLVGLVSLHRLSFVQEPLRTINPLLMRDLLLEARQAVRGLSSVAGLVRIGRMPWLPPRTQKVPVAHEVSVGEN